LVATGGTGGIVRLFDTRTSLALAEAAGHSRPINALSFTPDDRQLVSVGDDGSIFVWSVYREV
jgi:WD40 repeat protein